MRARTRRRVCCGRVCSGIARRACTAMQAKSAAESRRQMVHPSPTSVSLMAQTADPMNRMHTAAQEDEPAEPDPPCVHL